MAIDKLSLYNDALRILGERKLASLTEEREPRFRLDDVYDFGAIEFCLELARPRFATKVAVLNTPTPSTTHSLDNVFTLPSDYIVQTGVFSNDGLDEPVNRYIIEGRTLATDHDVIYLRYLSSDTGVDFALWTPSFARVVSAYLAHEIAPRIRPDAVDATVAKFKEVVEAFTASDASEETRPRAKKADVTLNTDLLNIYNDALVILKQEHLVSVNDDSHRRSALDAVFNTGIVEYHLEDTAWRWAIKSQKIQYNPSLEPTWGYRRVFDEPADMLRIDGVFTDEYFSNPLKDYAHEDGKIYCELTEIYVQYVSRDMLTAYPQWPAYFRKVIAADLAVHAAGLMQADAGVAMAMLTDRVASAKSNDAMKSPPRRLTDGNWTRARLGRNNRNYRNRP